MELKPGTGERDPERLVVEDLRAEAVREAPPEDRVVNGCGQHIAVQASLRERNLHRPPVGRLTHALQLLGRRPGGVHPLDEDRSRQTEMPAAGGEQLVSQAGLRR